MIGSCHTVDAAYGLLHELRDDRLMAIQTSAAKDFETKAEALKAKRMAESDDEVEQLMGLSVLHEIEARREIHDKNVAAAKHELDFIEECIQRINPHRKYANYPDPIAFELAQREEWRLELINRAENALMTSGTIPMDEFNTMRMHPDFRDVILPAIVDIKKCLEMGQIERRLNVAEGSTKKILLDFIQEKEHSVNLLAQKEFSVLSAPDTGRDSSPMF